MAEYISSFITGFEEVVSRQIIRDLKGIRIISVYSGLLHYAYAGHPPEIARVFYLNNSFLIFKVFKQKSLAFEQMAGGIDAIKIHPLQKKGSFRVRFSKENQFKKVPKKVFAQAEKFIEQKTHLTIDRLNPDTEFWFITRREGIGFFGQLLQKRKATEKNLRKGELRPELAFLLCCCCVFTPSTVFCDPFAGYGAIPMQVLKHFPFSKIYISDKDPLMVDYLRKTPLGQHKNIEIFQTAAENLRHIKKGGADVIITDPPWGFYQPLEEINAFYHSFMREARRVLNEKGTLLLLVNNQERIMEAAKAAYFNLSSSFPVLVNGKKANVLIFTPLRHPDIN